MGRHSCALMAAILQGLLLSIVKGQKTSSPTPTFLNDTSEAKIAQKGKKKKAEHTLFLDLTDMNHTNPGNTTSFLPIQGNFTEYLLGNDTIFEMTIPTIAPSAFNSSVASIASETKKKKKGKKSGEEPLAMGGPSYSKDISNEGTLMPSQTQSASPSSNTEYLASSFSSPTNAPSTMLNATGVVATKPKKKKKGGDGTTTTLSTSAPTISPQPLSSIKGKKKSASPYTEQLASLFSSSTIAPSTTLNASAVKAISSKKKKKGGDVAATTLTTSTPTLMSSVSASPTASAGQLASSFSSPTIAPSTTLNATTVVATNPKKKKKGGDGATTTLSTSAPTISPQPLSSIKGKKKSASPYEASGRDKKTAIGGAQPTISPTPTTMKSDSTPQLNSGDKKSKNEDKNCDCSFLCSVCTAYYKLDKHHRHLKDSYPESSSCGTKKCVKKCCSSSASSSIGTDTKKKPEHKKDQTPTPSSKPNGTVTKKKKMYNNQKSMSYTYKYNQDSLLFYRKKEKEFFFGRKA